MAVAAQFGGDLLVGGLVVVGGAQDDAAAEDQSLGRGAGADEGLELVAEFVGQFDGRAEGTRHGCPPASETGLLSWRTSWQPTPPSARLLAANL